jgi:hypothetical protein
MNSNILEITTSETENKPAKRIYLTRSLVSKSKDYEIAIKWLLHNKLLKTMNRKIKKLAKVSREHGFDVYKLTRLEGNCLFESLIYLGYGDNVAELRDVLAYIMYQYRNYKGFFPNQKTETLKSLYDIFNDIPSHVYDVQKKEIIKYEYETMCADLTRNGSWTRLNTNLILQVVSRIFDVRIYIFSSENDAKTEVSYNPDIKYKKRIVLGHLDDSHYVPLIKRSVDDMPEKPILYPILEMKKGDKEANNKKQKKD